MKFSETIRQDTPSSKEDITIFKAAVWALGQIGSTSRGIELLLKEDVVEELIELAEGCPVLSIRGSVGFLVGFFAEGGVSNNVMFELKIKM